MRENDITKQTGLALHYTLLAGLAGGFAEILWIALYTSLTTGSGVEVARQVTATLFPSVAGLPTAPAIGIAIPLVLSVTLAVVFVRIVWIPFAKRIPGSAGVIITVAALIAVWGINFFIVLPVVNPSFATLMPYGITLISKALFGAAMAWSLRKSIVPCRAYGPDENVGGCYNF